MSPSVKRVSKARSNKKPSRPKTNSPADGRTTVPEIVDSMTSVAPAGSPAGRVVLGASCTIHEAAALRSQLIAHLATPGPYEIEGGVVESVDTAGVQLIVAFALDCLEKGVHYTWLSRSPPLEEAIRTLGVGALLESPGAATSYSVGAA